MLSHRLLQAPHPRAHASYILFPAVDHHRERQRSSMKSDLESDGYKIRIYHHTQEYVIYMIYMVY